MTMNRRFIAIPAKAPAKAPVKAPVKAIHLGLLLGLFAVMPLAAQAALAPPPGFFAAAGNNGKNPRPCESAPAPFTGKLIFPSKYEGSGKARDDLNPQAYAKYRNQTEPINTMEKEVSAHIANYLETGREEGLRCVLGWLDGWAEAGALLSTDSDHTGKAVRKWALASLASAWLRLKFSGSGPLKNHAGEAQRIEHWFGQLAGQVVRDWKNAPLEKMNNHEYWAAWAVMAAAVVLDDSSHYKWAVKQYRIAAGQVDRDGYLPNELKRETRALAYHNYSLGPLAMIAAFAKANGTDLTHENGDALQRLATRVLSGVDDPGIFKDRTGHKQVLDDLQDESKFAWLEPYCWMLSCDGTLAKRRDSLRPMRTYRLGGDVTRLFAGQGVNMPPAKS
jgi:poly(beta-D-mannuronate) lyase